VKLQLDPLDEAFGAFYFDAIPRPLAQCPDVTPTEKSLWAFLAAWTRSEAGCWRGSLSRLAADAALARCTVVKALRRLRDLELVERVEDQSQALARVRAYIERRQAAEPGLRIPLRTAVDVLLLSHPDTRDPA